MQHTFNAGLAQHVPEGLYDEMMTYDQVAVLLSVPKGTLYSWRSRGLIPYVRVGRRLIRFRRSELEAWLAGKSVYPQQQQEERLNLSPSSLLSTWEPSRAEDVRGRRVK